MATKSPPQGAAGPEGTGATLTALRPDEHGVHGPPLRYILPAGALD